MIVTKNIRISNIIRWTGHHLVWLTTLMTIVALLYYFDVLNVVVPWQPISMIATAVAFYLGFKNNQAYDRMWEARKIWGGIVNDSRTWGMMIDAYISNFFRMDKATEAEIHDIKKVLIYRHIAWLYIHREQLLSVEEWEHASQSGHMGRWAKFYRNEFGLGLIDDSAYDDAYKHFLSNEDLREIKDVKNQATQIINIQSRALQKLRENDTIDDFRHMELENILRSFYALQGKNERIKKFPLPRQYANISRIFVAIFIALLPFYLVPTLMSAHSVGIYLSIFLSVIVSWVYVCMEIVGDYSENPFQGMANDIPMLSLCRTIEIDLREILNEKKLPTRIKSNKGILM